MAKIDGLLCRPEMGWMFNFKTNSELKEFLLSVDILTVVIDFLKFPVEICENPGKATIFFICWSTSHFQEFQSAVIGKK